jgi:hypothetical protein
VRLLRGEERERRHTHAHALTFTQPPSPCSLKTGLFKWKPDFEYAGELLDKAGNLFRLAKDQNATMETFLRSAEAHRNCGALFHAAKALENAAQAAKELKENKKVVEMIREAAKLYRTNRNHDAGALALEKAGA